VRVFVGQDETSALHETLASGLRVAIGADLLALELEHPVPSEVASPLRIVRQAGASPLLGVIAGFGATRELTWRSRQFAVVEIRGLDSQFYTTSAAPSSGACIGDSGGPLLWRDEDGAPLVLGVLSNGSGSCRGDDRYTRLDRVGDWLSTFIAGDTERRPGCAELEQRGLCASPELAVWCEGEELASQVCSDGAACGWDAKADGFRCVEPAADPCLGHSSFGDCANGIALRCDSGDLHEERCCDGRCVRDPISGRVGCGAG
jgi:hypothetical protein